MFISREALSLAALNADPYAAYDRWRSEAPVAFVEALGLWWVLDYEAVADALARDEDFQVGTDRSLIFDTFGENMLTLDGEPHRRQRNAFFGAFRPAHLRARMAAAVEASVDQLIDALPADGVELRQAFARVLPVLSILNLFGLDAAHATNLRRWYDRFEKALANFAWDETVRSEAKAAASEFRALIQAEIDQVRQVPRSGLLADTVADGSISDEEIQRNASIIFFGGISTVEAVTLNTLSALLDRPQRLEEARRDPARLALMVEETVRWRSPVQTATRHARRDVKFHGAEIKAGDGVSLILGAANRDPRQFVAPDQFDPDRPNLQRHLAFAAGSHLCLGAHFARLQANIAVGRLLQRLEGLRAVEPPVFQGHEFHQPGALKLAWCAKR